MVLFLSQTQFKIARGFGGISRSPPLLYKERGSPPRRARSSGEAGGEVKNHAASTSPSIPLLIKEREWLN